MTADVFILIHHFKQRIEQSSSIHINIFPLFGTAFAFIALLPVILVWKAFKMADEWMIKWNNPEANRQKVPYELLLVNVSTIGIHFLTGILLSIAYILSS